MDEDQIISDKSEDQKTSESNTVGQASVITNLDQLIKNYVQSIDKITEEAKKQKEMLDDIFINDSTYREHDEQAKEAAKVKAATKAQIMKQPQVFELSEKIKSMRSEIKELKAALSDYLKEYQRMTGANEVEVEDGEPREIIFTARLVKRNSKFRQ